MADIAVYYTYLYLDDDNIPWQDATATGLWLQVAYILQYYTD